MEINIKLTMEAIAHVMSKITQNIINVLESQPFGKEAQ
jgi:hypothetical protein